MSATLDLRALYDGDPDQIFSAACRFSEMVEAMAGFATYDGIPVDAVAHAGQVFDVDVTILRLFRIRGHRIRVETVDHENRRLQSRESGKGIRRWDHCLTVQPSGQHAEWRDLVVIDAGWRTPLVVRFAAMMYKRRHRHRRAKAITIRIA
jgi:hypothetical protein